MRVLPLEEDVTRTMAKSVSAMTEEMLGGGWVAAGKGKGS